jgi:putative SOS response-associated peptidase YedK
MCANYGYVDVSFEAFSEVGIVFDPGPGEFYPGYNVPAMRADGAAALKWGLLPFWSKTAKIEYSTFNARSETLAKSSSFREPFKKRRCLLPASHFYEWSKEKPKVRHRFGTDGPFCFAGLWDRWVGEETIESCTLITTTANATLEPFHHRMPVILHPSDYGLWLDPAASQDSLMALLVPYDGAMTVAAAPKSRKAS